MMLRCSWDFVGFLVELAIVLMFLLSTSDMKQCKRKNIRNLGIKMCPLKCNENNLCSDYEYHIETLPCPLSRNNSKKNEKQEADMGLSRNDSNVLTGSSSSETYRLAQRCLPTQPRKAICEQDGNPPEHDMDKQESFADSPFHDACRKGNLARVRHILSRGSVDINSRDGNHGRTPLMVAAQAGHCRIFEFLIRKGANMSKLDNEGKNFLHWTYKGGHVGMVKCVLPQYGVHIKNRHVPLNFQAASMGQTDVLEFLVCLGANMSHVNHNGENVMPLASKGGYVSLVKYLLSEGSVDINGRTRSGLTPLMIATRQRHINVVEFLVCMGANMSQVDRRGHNVMHWVCSSGHLGTAKYLFSQGSVDINGRTRSGLTPLMLCTLLGRRAILSSSCVKELMHHSLTIAWTTYYILHQVRAQDV